MISTNPRPLVSVLMTAYNRDKFIAEAIESVLASSFKDLELIIVDDCSTDKTLDIAKTFQQIDTRIKVFRNEENLGDYTNRNIAATYATGKYIKYLDADDTIYPHGLEVMVAAMEKYPNAAFGIQSNKREDFQPYPISSMPVDSFYEHYFKGGLLLSGPTGTIIKKDVFYLEGGFSGKRFVGDTELWLKLSSKYEIVKFQPSLIWWRSHDDQEIKKEMKYFEPVFTRYELDKFYLSTVSCPLDKKLQKIALNKLNRRFLLNILRHSFFQKNKINTLKYIFTSKMNLFNVLSAIFRK